MPDSWRSIDTGPRVEIKEKGSRFLGRAIRVDSEEASIAALGDVRREYHDARHHCWAHRLGSPGRVAERADDDGEPSGTAGPPILSLLQGDDLHDVLVVVTRWFGGTKLGKGGLVRAYSECGREALAAAAPRTVWNETTFVVECAYPDVGAVEAVLSREGDRVRDCVRGFESEPRFEVTVLASHVERLATGLREATGGRAAVHVTR